MNLRELGRSGIRVPTITFGGERIWLDRGSGNFV